MRLPKRGEKGFTLIELLIVVAILGVLAAVVIPNVSRFIGRGEEEAADTELSNIQSAVVSMMVDNSLSKLPTPVGTSTNDMGAFPDTSPIAAGKKELDLNGDPFLAGGDLPGYVLYQHDLIADGTSGNLTNYVAKQFTAQYYTVDDMGTVTQFATDNVTP